MIDDGNTCDFYNTWLYLLKYVNTYILITDGRAIYAKLPMQIFFANSYYYVCLH